MGFTTNVTISNDFFDRLERDPGQFVAAIRDGMNDSFAENEDQRPRRNYVMVHHARHADEPQIIYAHANLSYPIHELAFYGAIEAGDRRTLRSAVDALRFHADRLEARLDALDNNHGGGEA